MCTIIGLESSDLMFTQMAYTCDSVRLQGVSRVVLIVGLPKAASSFCKFPFPNSAWEGWLAARQPSRVSQRGRTRGHVDNIRHDRESIGRRALCRDFSHLRKVHVCPRCRLEHQFEL